MKNEAKQFTQAIKISQLCEMLRCSPATAWRRLKTDSGFPRPYKNGRSTLWDYQEVINWIEKLKDARPAFEMGV